MISPPLSPFMPSLTIESVHGLKETFQIGPNGISPATSPGSPGGDSSPQRDSADRTQATASTAAKSDASLNSR